MVALALGLLLSGCISATSYVDPALSPVSLAEVTPPPIRGRCSSNFADYLAEALRIELSTAGCLAPDAPVSVTGAMRRNGLDAENFDTGTATVRGALRRASRRARRLRAHPAYLGAIAILRAQQE